MSSIATPSGEVTFLFTDVQGSSALWEEFGDVMGEALAEHDRRMREAIAEHNGYVFTTAGDSFAVAFAQPSQGLAAAVAAQLRLAEPAPGPEILVRMALHTGAATEREGDYFGPVLNRCARLMSAGHGGQVLVSEKTAGLLRGVLSDGLDLVDLGEHQLKDLSRPEHIYQIAIPSLEGGFPRLRTVDAVSSNLPIQLTSFVGRDDELAEVSGLMSGSRLVTLAGSGGSGKTRMALQLAADSVEKFPGGVGWVDLAPIADPELIDDTFGATFDAKETPGTPLVDAIAAKIGERQLLLVVDNCEHLVARIADIIGQLLTRTTGLKVLATSQVQLGIPGEVIFRVPPLGLPEGQVDAHTARGFDAVRLFTDRAVLARPSFEVDAENVDAVLAICRRLDGIPLALELAAARLNILSPTQIAQRLDERFQLLTSSSKLTEERHQTLRATIDWSHDLLEEEEQALFRRCGAFAGTFGIEALEAVGDGDPIAQGEVLDLLSALTNKSLVVVEDKNNETRYRLLDSMRQYARGQLETTAESESISLRHLAYFSDFAEELQRTYRRDELSEALGGLRADRDNMRAALEFGLSNGHVEEAGRIIAGIGYLWYIDGTFQEGIDWCERLYSLEPDLPPALMASFLHSYGTLLGSWAEPAAGADLLGREVALRRGLDEPMRLVAALNNYGNMLTDTGRYQEAEAALREAVDLMRSLDESPSMPLSALAWASLHAGDHDNAVARYEEALADARSAQNAFNTALAMAGLGQCLAQMGRLAEARSFLEDAHQRYTDLGVPPGVLDVLMNLALVDKAEGKTTDAAHRLLTVLKDPDSHWYLGAKFWVLQLTAGLVEDPSVAAELVGTAAAYYDSVEDVPQWFFTRDLELSRQELREALGDEAFASHFEAGGTRAHAEAIALAVNSLAALADGAPPPTPAGSEGAE